jgi:hypothetical protein
MVGMVMVTVGVPLIAGGVDPSNIIGDNYTNSAVQLEQNSVLI